MPQIYLMYFCNFNPRSREGSDSFLFVHCQADIDFNPRSREGSDATSQFKFPSLSTFQSTLPRRERLSRYADQLAFSDISIHAPAKGATGAEHENRSDYKISIHAPAKGATLLRNTETPESDNFNPRSREGSDR